MGKVTVTVSHKQSRGRFWVEPVGWTPDVSPFGPLVDFDGLAYHGEEDFAGLVLDGRFQEGDELDVSPNELVWVGMDGRELSPPVRPDDTE